MDDSLIVGRPTQTEMCHSHSDGATQNVLDEFSIAFFQTSQYHSRKFFVAILGMRSHRGENRVVSSTLSKRRRK